METVISHSFWIWLVVIGAWSLGLSMFDFALLHAGEKMSHFGIYCFAIFLLCIVAAAIAGTITFIEYHQAWPFLPQ